MTPIWIRSEILCTRGQHRDQRLSDVLLSIESTTISISYYNAVFSCGTCHVAHTTTAVPVGKQCGMSFLGEETARVLKVQIVRFRRTWVDLPFSFSGSYVRTYRGTFFPSRAPPYTLRYDLSHHVSHCASKSLFPRPVPVIRCCDRNKIIQAQNKPKLSIVVLIESYPTNLLPSYLYHTRSLRGLYTHIHLTSQRNHYHPQNGLHIHHQRRLLHRQGRSRPDA